MSYYNRDLEPLLIGQRDFELVGQVAKHCSFERLSEFIREQQNLSLLPKIGYCLFNKLMMWCQGYCLTDGDSCDISEENVLKHLWVGGRYTSCDGTVKMHFGLRRSLVHWSYGAYVYRHGLIDTPTGVVQKINQDSIPVDVKELSKLNVEHRNKADWYYDMTLEYLCSVKDCEILSDCKICECIKGCPCTSCEKKNKGTLHRRTVRFKTIEKD